MTTCSKVFVLTQKTKSRIENYGLSLICHKCGKPLELGEEIASHRSGSQHRTVYHCLACWCGLWLDPRTKHEGKWPVCSGRAEIEGLQ